MAMVVFFSFLFAAISDTSKEPSVAGDHTPEIPLCQSYESFKEYVEFNEVPFFYETWASVSREYYIS